MPPKRKLAATVAKSVTKTKKRTKKEVSPPSPIPIPTTEKSDPSPITIPTLNFFKNNNSTIPIPSQFTKTHSLEFLDAIQFVLNKDPALLPAFQSSNAFSIRLQIDPTDTDPTNKDDNYYFHKLVSSLISQQLSGKAAESIRNKIITNLSPDTNILPTPEIFYEASEEQLRSCGLSIRKVEYVKGLSKCFIPSESPELLLNEQYFKTQPSLKISQDLQSLKGIGPWSASMFLIFALERLDVFEIGDLGVRRGLSYYIKDRPELISELSELFKNGAIMKKPGKKVKFSDKYITDFDMADAIVDQFKPYRTLFMLILWKISDTSVEAMGKR